MARYELGERIGLGGMAEIFRGKATAGGGFEKPVAIKRILPHLSQDKRFVEALITEAKTLSRLRHRNVVQIYDVGLGDDGQYFLVMEYVDGLDLGRMYESLEKRSRRLPLDVALYITGEVCEALEHAHNARGEDGQPLGLVHRDVSPSNVLLSRSGEVKLTDFGIAKRTEEATGHGGVRGKFAYISPEQAHNKRVDARSDVYSLGILLFELVTGHRLFSDLPDFEALRAVREGRMPRPRDIDPGIDAELERILLTGLAPRPEDRFPSAGTLGAQLRTCRYSIVSSVADPAIEIARLVDEYASQQDQKVPAREPNVVRISTVAGFSGSIEVPEDLSGPSITGEVTRIPPASLLGLDEEEETRAVKLSTVGPLPTAPARTPQPVPASRTSLPPPSRSSQPASPSRSSQAAAPARTSQAASPARTSQAASPARTSQAASPARSSQPASPSRSSQPGAPSRSSLEAALAREREKAESDLADAETRVLDYRPSDLFPDLAGDSGAVEAVSHAENAGPHLSPSNGGLADDQLGRAPTPTIRQLFYTGALIDDGREPSPAAPSGPIMDSHLTAARRRAILLAGAAAVVLAVLSFVIAGAFMGGGDTAVQAIPVPDAAPQAPPPVDAAPPPAPTAAPPEPAPAAPPPPPERPKKKKKKPPRKRPAKPEKVRSSSDRGRSTSDRPRSGDRARPGSERSRPSEKTRSTRDKKRPANLR
jgi:eukaryotic-like serine/threonine-protein kinase